MVLKILVTGAGGTLGKYLVPEIQWWEPSAKITTNVRWQCDLSNWDKVYVKYGGENYDIIVHCAAYTDVAYSNFQHEKVLKDNIYASTNMIRLAERSKAKLVFISTDFVFDGKVGQYSPTDKINPQTVYAKSKASTELALACYPNSLVIRTSFFGETFPFPKACTDRFTSKDYIDVIAPLITKEVLSDKKGICHVGTEKKSFYDLASRRNPDVEPMKCLDESCLNKDHSFYDKN